MRNKILSKLNSSNSKVYKNSFKLSIKSTQLAAFSSFTKALNSKLFVSNSKLVLNKQRLYHNEFLMKQFSSDASNKEKKATNKENYSISNLSRSNNSLYIKLNNGLGKNEFKLPLYSNHHDEYCEIKKGKYAEYTDDQFEFHSFFFNKQEKASELLNKINDHFNGNIIVEFCLNNNNTNNNINDIYITDLLATNFIIKINVKKELPSLSKQNKDLEIHCIPDIERVITLHLKQSNLTQKPNKKEKIETVSEINILNRLLLTNSTNIKELKVSINNLIAKYTYLEKEMSLNKEKLESLINKETTKYSILAILYFLAHLIIFYFLIYELYGWDNIEPITYLVGNVYWIVALSFFVYKKKKLDLELLFRTPFIAKSYKKFITVVNYNRTSHVNVQTQLIELKNLENIINSKI